MTVIAFSVALLLLYGSIIVIWEWVSVREEPLASDEQREEWFRFFSTNPEYVKLKDSLTGDWLLTEAKFLLSQKIDAIKGYEGKATTQFSIVGSGVGVVTVIGGADFHALQGNLWVVITGVALLFASLLANIVSITFWRLDEMPYADPFNYYKILQDPDMKAKVQYTMIEGYLTISNRLAAICVRKQRLLMVATITFVVGLGIVAGNYISAASQANHEPTQIKLVQ